MMFSLIKHCISVCSIFCGFGAFAAETTLSSAVELNDFCDDARRRYNAFCLTGVVQSVSVNPTKTFILSDCSGRTELRNATPQQPLRGERIIVGGHAHMSSHQESDLVAEKIERIGRSDPEADLVLPLGAISEDDHHLHTITTEGTIIDILPDEIDQHNRFLLLKDAESVLPVAVTLATDDRTDLGALRDARVRVRGVFRRTVSGCRKFSGPFIAIDDLADLARLTTAPADPFDVPPLEKTLYRSPREIAKRGKRRIEGEVLAVWQPNRLMVRTPDSRIVNVALAHEEAIPKPGAFVLVAGYPETDLLRVNLSRAIIRPLPAHRAEETPDDPITDLAEVYSIADNQQTIDPTAHGRLMKLQGTIISVSAQSPVQRRLLLSCGPNKLTVELGDLAIPEDDLAIGTTIEVIGRGRLETDSWTPTDILPRIRNVTLVLRTPEDLHVLARPPWWTPFKLLVVITLLVTALIGGYIWNRVLRRIVNRRGRELYREQVAHAIASFKTGERTRLAVELHDSLSQVLAGVACHVAACARTIDSSPAMARRCIRTADKLLNSCRTELRQCLFDLRSDTLEEPDFSAAIRKTLEQLDGKATMNIEVNIPRSHLKDTTAHAILAIIRELTGNAIRHGAATEIRIDGKIANGEICLTVSDNGCGFDPLACAGPGQGHFGLEGIRNRLVRLNGRLTLTSQPEHGTKASISLPA